MGYFNNNLSMQQVIQIVTSKLLHALGFAYFSSQVTKFLRVVLAIFLIPFAEIVLHKIQKRFSVSERKAFWFVSATLIGMSILAWSGVVFLELLNYFVIQGDFVGY